MVVEYTPKLTEKPVSISSRWLPVAGETPQESVRTMLSTPRGPCPSGWGLLSRLDRRGDKAVDAHNLPR